jgi:hypothetical protein
MFCICIFLNIKDCEVGVILYAGASDSQVNTVHINTQHGNLTADKVRNLF